MSQKLFAGGLLAFVSTAVLIWALIPVAHRIGLVDHPGGRKTHRHPTPLVGGIAMFVAFAFSALMLNIPLFSYRMLFAGLLLLVVVGAIDDLHELPASCRFVAQILAGLLMTLGGNVVLVDLGYLILPDSLLSLGNLAVPVTVFAMVGVINALNMADGIDGLAASLVLIAIIALGIVIAWSGGDTRDIDMLGLLGAVLLAFLVFNLRAGRRTSVFMGDAGSLSLGFVLVWFLVALSQGEQRLLAPVTALWLFALPLIDTVSIMTRRILHGRSPFRADRGHFHHILLAAGFRPKQVLVLMLLSALTTAGIGLVGHFLGVPEHWMFLGFVCLFALHFWIIMRAWHVKHFLGKLLLHDDNPPA
ncbi:MAG: undecaprenyl-phosphate alpha-N-acetylglucosaminyl 1-phosphate transferase [Candidatus Thiosymbion ectosymbiont of Robbea hypermnestra]|nr:undecaprenyl-phosphate alpha-N-acetylglucosaminyl 1-phosphate transferase [Candidatus Thiosymbion ectosymbiont of Robbea hypermnestra]